MFNVLSNVDPECSFFFSLPLSLPLFPTRAYTRVAYLIIVVRFDRSLLRRKRWNTKREKNGMLKKAACEKFLKGVGGCCAALHAFLHDNNAKYRAENFRKFI